MYEIIINIYPNFVGSVLLMCPFLIVNICKSYLGFNKASSDCLLTRNDGSKEKPRLLSNPDRKEHPRFFQARCGRMAGKRKPNKPSRSLGDSFLIGINLIKTISLIFVMLNKQVVFLHA